jgi:hypothetical protein
VITASEVDELCQWLAGVQADKRPALLDHLFSNWIAVEIRDHLVMLVAQAVTDGALTAGQATTWRAFWGMEGPRTARGALARTSGISPTGVYKRRRRAAEVVAARLGSVPEPPQRSPGPASPPAVSVEEAVAAVHAELAMREEATPSTLAAVVDLRRDLLGAKLPKTYPGSNKHARARARQELRRRLAQTLVPNPSVALSRPSRPGGDAAALADLIVQAEPLYFARDPRVHDVLATARSQLGTLRSSLDPRLEATLWSVQAWLWREEEDIRTVWAARQVERMVGPQTVRAVSAWSDAAIVLEEHGYLNAATSCTERAVKNLRAAPLEDEAERRAELAGLITRAVEIATRQLLIDPYQGDWRAVRRRLDRLLDLVDHHGDEPITGWALIAYRRRVQLDLVHGLRERRRENYRRGLTLAPDTYRYVEQATREAARTTTDVYRMGWQATLLNLHLERGDPDAFAAVAREFVGFTNATPWQYVNQLEKYARLVERAERRRDRAWRRIALPRPQGLAAIEQATGSTSRPNVILRQGAQDEL